MANRDISIMVETSSSESPGIDNSKKHQEVANELSVCRMDVEENDSHLDVESIVKSEPTEPSPVTELATETNPSGASSALQPLQNVCATQSILTAQIPKCDRCNIVFINEQEVNVHTKDFHRVSVGQNPTVNLIRIALKKDKLGRFILDPTPEIDRPRTRRMADLSPVPGILPSGPQNLRVASSINNHECRVCDKVFGSSQTLKQHEINIHGLKFSCKVCGKVHKESDKIVFYCNVCEVKIYSLCKLRQHRRLYHEGKTFVCHICGEGFFLPDSLQSHVNIHKEENTFCCDACGYTFDDRKKFMKHRKELCKVNL